MVANLTSAIDYYTEAQRYRRRTSRADAETHSVTVMVLGVSVYQYTVYRECYVMVCLFEVPGSGTVWSTGGREEES